MTLDMHWLLTAFNDIVGFLPSLVAGLVILLVGYIIARILAGATRPLLHRIGFDRLLASLGFVPSTTTTTAATTPGGPTFAVRGSRTASYWAGSAVFAVVMLATLMQVARAWRLDLVAIGIARILAYLPNLIGAALILGVAILAGDWARKLIRRQASADGAQQTLLAGAVRAGILALGAFMALRELLIAPEIVTLAFGLTFGAIALATALAFGLGSRSVAERVTRDWYEERGKKMQMPMRPVDDRAHPHDESRL